MYEVKQNNNIQRDYHRELYEDKYGNEKMSVVPIFKKILHITAGTEVSSHFHD